MKNRNEIAYIIKGYPRLSEAFISNEIYLLEKLGLNLQLFVVKKEKEAKSHAVVDKIRAPINYLPKLTSLTASNFFAWLWDNLPKFTRVHWRLLKQRPWPYIRTLLRASSYCFVHRTRRFSMPKKAYIKEFLQAGYIAQEVLRLGTVRHLHAHFCHGSTTIAMFAGELAGLPFSFTAHAKDIYQPRLNPGTLLQKKIHRSSFVATCTGANHTYLQNISLNGTPIHTVYHGLDTEKFQAAFERNGTLEPQILSVGRFVEKKGFPFLLKACRILKGKGLRFSCVMIGEPGDQSETISKMIAELKLQDEITLHGAMTHPELIEMYRTSDLFVLPCIVASDGDRDGIPNVLAEAMAMSLPVVSTQVSGIPELVTDGEDGILVSQKDENALAAVLEKLIKQNALRKQLGQAARAKICRIFDAEKNTVRMKALFDGVMREA
ncbi:MAG: glycosyltransferase [bacterium]